VRIEYDVHPFVEANRTQSDVVQQLTVDAGRFDITSAQPEVLTRSGKKERTRARLLGAAEEVFGLRGFNDASIVEITQRAGVALGTFYVYFPSKTSIFNYIVETRIADLRDHLRAAQEKARGQAELERAVLRAFMEWATMHPNAYRAARQADYVEGTRLRDWYTMFVEDYASRLSRAMDAGALARTNPEVLAWSVIGMADLLATHWITWTAQPPQIPADQLDAFLDIAVRTLGVHAEAS
jgi:AcrR family transcriptional regulator